MPSDIAVLLQRLKLRAGITISNGKERRLPAVNERLAGDGIFIIKIEENNCYTMRLDKGKRTRDNSAI